MADEEEQVVDLPTMLIEKTMTHEGNKLDVQVFTSLIDEIYRRYKIVTIKKVNPFLLKPYSKMRPVKQVGVDYIAKRMEGGGCDSILLKTIVLAPLSEKQKGGFTPVYHADEVKPENHVLNKHHTKLPNGEVHTIITSPHPVLGIVEGAHRIEALKLKSIAEGKTFYIPEATYIEFGEDLSGQMDMHVVSQALNYTANVHVGVTFMDKIHSLRSLVSVMMPADTATASGVVKVLQKRYHTLNNHTAVSTLRVHLGIVQYILPNTRQYMLELETSSKFLDFMIVHKFFTQTILWKKVIRYHGGVQLSCFTKILFSSAGHEILDH